MAGKPHSRFPHLFVVVRIDESQTAAAIEDAISLVSAFESEDTARRDAERLDALNRDRGSRYVVFTTRLKH